MNDAATDYYTEMSEIKKKLYEKKCLVLDMKLKMLKSKQKVQELRSKYYERCLNALKAPKSKEKYSSDLSFSDED